MKTSILTTLTILVATLVSPAQNAGQFSSGFPKEINLEVRPVYARAVKPGSFNDAKLISDVVSGYPSNWISSYVSVEISGTCKGKLLSAVSNGEVLSEEQKNILKQVDLTTNLNVNIKYKYKCPLTSEIENNIIKVTMTVVPEKEAEYANGHEELIRFLKEHSIRKIAETDLKTIKAARVLFTIDEEGKVTDVTLVSPSGNTKADKTILSAIEQMPKWKPAKDAKGVGVKQQFQFILGSLAGC